jgi:hypothetical protein
MLIKFAVITGIVSLGILIAFRELAVNVILPAWRWWHG